MRLWRHFRFRFIVNAKAEANGTAKTDNYEPNYLSEDPSWTENFYKAGSTSVVRRSGTSRNGEGLHKGDSHRPLHSLSLRPSPSAIPSFEVRNPNTVALAHARVFALKRTYAIGPKLIHRLFRVDGQRSLD
jgi:hypothetical protein